MAPALLGAGRALEQLGRRDEAARAYATFIELWRDCDPELRPMVDDATIRLKRLSAR